MKLKINYNNLVLGAVALLLTGILVILLTRDYKPRTELEQLNLQKAIVEERMSDIKKEIVVEYKEYLRLKDRRQQLIIKIDSLINSGSIPVSLEWMPEYFEEHPELFKDTGETEVNDEGKLQKKFPNNIKTVKEFLARYGLEYTYDYWYDMGKKYNIKPELGICIAWADSNLGKALKSSYNLGNVANNDRGNVQHYEHIRAGIEAIYRVLNNQYLGSIKTIGGLSCGGRQRLYEMGIIGKDKLCGNKGAYVYASSEYNWNKNVVNCMQHLVDKDINETYNFRF